MEDDEVCDRDSARFPSDRGPDQGACFPLRSGSACRTSGGKRVCVDMAMDTGGTALDKNCSIVDPEWDTLSDDRGS